MKIIFMGTPQFASTILEKLIEQKKNIILVVTQPDQKIGRQQKVVFSEVKELAIKHNISYFQPYRLRDEVDYLLKLKPDLIITAAYGQMLPKILLDQVKVLNVHGSLLPKYRGGAPIQRALMNGEDILGVTIMRTALKMDSGPILNKGSIKLEKNDDYGSVSNKLSLLGAELLIDVLNNNYEEIPQDEAEATYAPILTLKDEFFDFNQNTEQLINQLRGLLPTPAGRFFHKEMWFKIYKIEKNDIITHTDIEPGTIISLNKKMIVKTKDGAINILEIQQSGKKRLAIKDFLNGQNIFIENECIGGGKKFI